MESWTKRGRPAIFEAIANVCDRIGADIQAEARELDKQLVDAATRELDGRRDEFLRLERENQVLRAEVLRLRQSAALQASVAVDLASAENAHQAESKRLSDNVRNDEPRISGRTALQELSTNRPTAKESTLKASTSTEVDRLRKEKSSLASRLGKLDKNYKAVVSQCRKYKAAQNEWMEYALRLESLVSEFKRRPAMATSEVHEQSSLGLLEPHPDVREGQEDRVEPANVPIASTNFGEGGDRAKVTRLLPTMENEGLVEQSDARGLQNLRFAAVTPRGAVVIQGSLAELEKPVPKLHSDETQGDPLDQGSAMPSLPPLPAQSTVTDVVIKLEPSSDGPIVVSERSLRKRRREDDDEVQGRRIKTESSDSEAVAVDQTLRSSSSPPESMDLDNVGYHVPTPRKHRRLRGDGPSDSPAQRRGSSGIADHPTTGASGSLEEIAHGPASAAAPLHTTVQSSAVSLAQTGQVRPSAERSVETPSNDLRSRRRDDSPSKVGELAEDGNAYRREIEPEPVPEDLRENTVRRPGGRLAKLLNTSSKPPTWTKESAGPSVYRETRPNAFDAMIPPPRFLPFANGGLGSKQATPATNKSAPAHLGPGRIASPHTPIFQTARRAPESRPPGNSSFATPGFARPSTLRSKPTSSLKREDFKLNPQANSGQSHAFSEVVRNKGERSCLPGCTAAQCCGPHFRALARAQRHASTSEQDRRLMEDYLGDEAWTLRKMSDLDREDVWLEAKTRELADKYGRHRERFGRMPSPPGFWRTDFPDTQEVAQEKAQAAARERDTVEQRYREAMRPGGRWLFRDE